MDRVDYYAVGKRLRYVRKGRHMTQSKLAELTRLSNNYVSQIENGNAKFSMDVFIRLIEVLEVSADYILQDVVWSDVQKKHDYEYLPDVHRDLIHQMVNLILQYHIVK